MTEKELKRLFRSYEQTRDPKLRDYLVLEHLELVATIAKKYLGKGAELADLVQTGTIGLIKAVEDFDPNAGNKFFTFAWHKISGEIRHELRDHTQLIKQPSWIIDLQSRINRAQESLAAQFGRTAEVTEIAHATGLNADRVREALSDQQLFLAKNFVSLDEPVEDDGNTVEETIMIGAGNLPGRIERRIVMKQALAQLPGLKRTAVTLFYYHGLTKTEIAQRLGLSVTYTSYLIRRGLSDLKEALDRLAVTFEELVSS